jgi:hypothetical protein
VASVTVARVGHLLKLLAPAGIHDLLPAAHVGSGDGETTGRGGRGRAKVVQGDSC